MKKSKSKPKRMVTTNPQNLQTSKSASADSQNSRHASSDPPSKTAFIDLFTLDYVLICAFTLLSMATRLYRIGTPDAVVFDELHFSKFTDRLLTKTWFFDIHPPLGKLILAHGSRLLGYRPDPKFVIQKIGMEYPAHINYILVRYISALFSIVTVPLTYLISRAMRISSAGACLSASTVLFDFLGLIEGRLILMDSQLLFFCQISLLSALTLWQTVPRSRLRIVMLITTGLLAGAALSIKHTALATPGLIAIISFFGIHFLDIPLTMPECLLAGVSGLVVYVTSFYIMFNSLWSTGGKYDNFMPLHFRKTLIGAVGYDPNAKRVSFLRLFLYMNRRMIESNANIKKRHTWESDWYHWIANWRGVLYYVNKFEKDGVAMRAQIYLLGNPVVALLVLFCVGLFILSLSLSVRYRSAFSKWRFHKELRWARANGIFLLCGWLCNLLPYILVDRAAFIYHYLPGLFYGQLLCGAVFDVLPGRVRNVLVFLLMACMTAAFVYWSPWIYSIPLTKEQHAERRWLPRWT